MKLSKPLVFGPGRDKSKVKCKPGDLLLRKTCLFFGGRDKVIRRNFIITGNGLLSYVEKTLTSCKLRFFLNDKKV